MTNKIILCTIIALAFLTKIDQISSCFSVTYGNRCCKTIPNFPVIPSIVTLCSVGSPWCNAFGGNCVVCEFVFIPAAGCQLITKCSCYYCCEEQYKDYCPQGCENCVTDGEGGCEENAKSREKFEGCASTGSTSNIRGGGETAFSKLKRKTEAQMAFEMIDTDLDGFISKEEGIYYLRTSQHQSSTPADLDKNSSWFDTMDRNGNKKIDPEEFDRLLGTK